VTNIVIALDGSVQTQHEPGCTMGNPKSPAPAPEPTIGKLDEHVLEQLRRLLQASELAALPEDLRRPVGSAHPVTIELTARTRVGSRTFRFHATATPPELDPLVNLVFSGAVFDQE
jgi:hypothetical protein